MTEYMAAVESNDNRLINTAQKNMRNILNGSESDFEDDIYFQQAKSAVEDFLEGSGNNSQNLIDTLRASDGEYEIVVNAGVCDECERHSHAGKLSEIDNIQLPQYHPNCKCKVEIYDGEGNMIDIVDDTAYRDNVNDNSRKSNNSDNTPWYGNGIKELIDDPLGTIKKHGVNLLEEIPLTNYLEAAFGYDLYGNKLSSDERLGKVGTAIEQGMDALLSAYMMGGIEVVGGAGNTLAKIGDDFGKLGKMIDNPNIKIDWKNTTTHGIERMTQRGATQDMINSWVLNGKVLQQSSGNYIYITTDGVAVLNSMRKLITTYTSTQFDDAMRNVVKQLFGE